MLMTTGGRNLFAQSGSIAGRTDGFARPALGLECLTTKEDLHVLQKMWNGSGQYLQDKGGA